MEFRTPLPITPSSLRIDHSTDILTLGSCFANVMGEKLLTYKFPAKVNPFGVIFNPFSILKVLEAAAENKDHFKDSYIQHHEVWYNYDLHSDFSTQTKEELQQKISIALADIHAYLKTAHIVTLTFGTAFIYKIAKTNAIVANCHKIPAPTFKKGLLGADEICREFERVYSLVKKINPTVRFILTVSPVRHIKDGIEQNSVSKSILRSACYLIREKLQDTEYFPSYEIMMDDLRDYRFYKEDMIHPSEVAENYIWEKFTEKYIENKSREIIKEWETIRKAIAHRPFHPESNAHQNFLNETIGKLRKLSSMVNVEKEIKELESRIT